MRPADAPSAAWDAIVIGAGPTGLACGIELKKLGVEAMILESYANAEEDLKERQVREARVEADVAADRHARLGDRDMGPEMHHAQEMQHPQRCSGFRLRVENALLQPGHEPADPHRQ